MKRKTILFVSLMLILIGTGLTLNYFLTETRAPLAFIVIAPAIITFFWFLSGSTLSNTINDGLLRKAITGSVVIAYIVLVGISSFWEGGSSTLAPLAQTMITSFTTVVSIVVAFYFGSSVYSETRKNGNQDKSNLNKNTKDSSSQPIISGESL